MLDLLRAEWLKLGKRPLTWILLAIFQVLMVLQLMMFWFITVISPLAPGEVQREVFTERLAFPGAFATVFSHINGLGGIFAVILAAGFIGSDYGWGTLRTHLAHYPNRNRYLLAKLLVVLLALLAGMLITLAVGMLAALGFGALLGPVSTPDAAALASLPAALLRALLVLLPYVLLTVAATVYGRSLMFGMASGLVFQLIDIAFGAITMIAHIGGLWQMFYNLMLQANINRLTYLNSQSFGIDPGGIDKNFDPALLPSLPQALVLIALYSAAFAGAAFFWLRRRDVSGAS